jgi:DNA repair protein RadC
MRITKYDLELSNERLPTLVKEESHNYKYARTLNTPGDIVRMMNEIFHLQDKAEERVYILAMDTKCKVAGVFEISKGTVNHSFASPREIFIRVLLAGVVNMIMIHNHPSGDPTPSEIDFNLYKRLKEVSNLMEINFCDNIIIGKDDYVSFNERKYL